MKSVQNITCQILDKAVPGKLFKTSQPGYQKKDNTTKNSQNIPLQLLEKTMPRKQHKTAQAKCKCNNAKKIPEDITCRMVEKKQYQKNNIKHHTWSIKEIKQYQENSTNFASRILHKTIPTKHHKRDNKHNNTMNTVQNITHRILDNTIPRKQHKTSHTGYQTNQYHVNSTKHHTPDTRQHSISNTTHFTSQDGYQTNQYQENCTKYYKPHIKQIITLGIQKKTIPRQQYKAPHTRNQYHEQSR